MSSNTGVKKILILAANPTNTLRLRLDEEVREIKQGLQRASKREQFKIEQEWAVRSRDFYRAMLDHQPHIVHFCGHGTGVDGIVLEDDTGHPTLIDKQELSNLFKVFAEKIECVVLNACYLKLNPNDAHAYNFRGLAYLYKKDYDRTIADYTQALKLDPKSADTYNNRGNVYSYRGDYDHAFADFAQSLRLDPKNAEAYYNRGSAYKNQGRKDKAIEDFKKVLELNNDVELSQKAKQELQQLGTK